MASHVTKGKQAIGTQLGIELTDRFKKYAEGRGETFTVALERAMAREMTYPPPEKPAPLEAVTKRGRTT